MIDEAQTARRVDGARWRTARMDDPAAIRAFLDGDRALNAYALGDLDPAFWPESAYLGAWQDDALRAVVLVYRGFEPPVLSAFGEPEGVAAILAGEPVPDEMYTLFPAPLADALATCYTVHNPHQEWRMVLDPARFAPPSLAEVARLGGEHAGALEALFAQAAEPGEAVVAFSPWQIAHGAFYGVWEGGALVAAAGTHVWSVAERVAAIGNVFTRPDRRGRGHAQRCTAAVVRDALDAGIDPVVLNVRMPNAPAIHVYEKLGFRRAYAFLEGPALKHGIRA